MRIDAISVFPQYFEPLTLSLVGKAREHGRLQLHTHDLRDWTTDRHRTVDDAPYGGGAGMVMLPEPWWLAVQTVLGQAAAQRAEADPAGEPAVAARPVILVPTPAGRPFTQAQAQRLATREHLVFMCGRYEGIDARVVEALAAEHEVVEFSLGDYVLNGGEVAALAVIEAVARLVPGVVGNPESLVEESHSDGLLEYPAYSRPAVWRDRPVPDVLLSGHHGNVARWRRDEQFRRTAERRPDLLRRLAVADLDRADLRVLAGLGWLPGVGGFLEPADGVAQ